MPENLKAFSNENRVYFDYGNGEILNYSDNYASTGFYFQDQRYIVTSPDGTQINPFYQYDTSAYQYASSGGYGKHYIINNTDVWMPRSYWSFEMADGRSFQDVFCVEVAPSDTAVWKYNAHKTGYVGYCSAMEGKDLYYGEWGRDDWTAMCIEWGEENDGYTGYGFASFFQQYKWVEDCRLYYNVRQKKTFEEVITEKLGSMSHSDERLQYYNLLVGNEDSSNAMYGNHQTLRNLLSGDSIRDYTLKREFGYEMNGWNQTSDGLYQGIKVYCANGEFLYAPFDCKITDVNTSEQKITLRKNDVQYWYDGSGGTKRDTEVTITNAKLLGGFEKGDRLKEGEEFAKTTAGDVNFHIEIDTDGG